MMTSQGSPILPTCLSAPLTLMSQSHLHDWGFILLFVDLPGTSGSLPLLRLLFFCFPTRSQLPQETALGQ